jgi:hypothetical protein
MHHNDVEKSLAAVGSVGPLRQRLEEIADPDVQASLIHLAAGDRERAPEATVSVDCRFFP